MAEPPTRDSKIAALTDLAAVVIRRDVKLSFPSLVGSKAGPTILDVGAGWPKYAYVLWEYAQIDACEGWPANASELRKSGQYRAVYESLAVDLKYEWYDVVIFGDVLEHMSVADAQECVEWALDHSAQVYVAVPYLYEQGPVDDNPLEEHVQDDLTPEVMAERYPGLRLLDGDDAKGIYVRADS